MTSAIYVGHAKDGMKEISHTILNILAANVADAVQLAALDALKYSLKIENITIQNCNFTTGETVPIKRKQ